MAIRVFELARELGVQSKAILDKCRAEEIELPNHMTALKAGLEATIREWFSESVAQTAVETTQHVDVGQARKKAASQRRRHKTADASEAPAPDVAETAVAGAETIAVAEIPVAEEPAAPVVVAEAATAVEASAAPAAPVEAAPAEPAPAEVSPTVHAPEPVVAPAPEVPAPDVAPAAQAPAPPPVSEVHKPAARPPERPKVMATGPQLVPRPAVLKGPRVVRFEKPEPVAPPRPRYVARRTGTPVTPITPQTPLRRPPVGPGVVGGPPKTAEEEKPKKAKRRNPRRKSGRTADTTEGLREWRDRDLAERSQRLAAAAGGTLRRHRPLAGGHGGAEAGARSNELELEEPVTVKSFSAVMGLKITGVIRKLMSQGVMATVNSPLDHRVAEAIALEHGIELKIQLAKSDEELLEEEFRNRKREELVSRAPVVAFLGHVDHGKTSLLDRIRSASVAKGEEGGITQGIGSYRYDMGDKHVVFLDTPGHEAFTAMRARGANMTDVVVLVVAADDGVMPQTAEAINHAKAAGVPIVVALNKIDLPNANIQKALGQLAEHGLQPREWGGTTEIIQTSATTGQGIPELVEVLSLEAELLELKADPKSPATGWVVEAKRDSARGITARLLVRDGTLKVGDVILAGPASGRVRNISNDRGQMITEAGPATPVSITGIDEIPSAGDKFYVLDDIARAAGIAETRRDSTRAKSLQSAPTTTLDNIFQKIESGAASAVKLIIKVDVQGSLEAILNSLKTKTTDEVRVDVLHAAVGGITEGDILLAEASQAIVMGFRVIADLRARTLGEQRGVEVRTYRVIYQLLEDVEKAVKGLLAPEIVEKVNGRIEVREVYKIGRIGGIAGCFVLDGTVTRAGKVRIIRNNVVVEDERELGSLRRFKDDVREVRAGLECGLKIAGYDDIKVGDIIESYQNVTVARTE